MESECLCINIFFGTDHQHSPIWLWLWYTMIQDASRSPSHLKLLSCHHETHSNSAILDWHLNWALSLCAGRLQSIDISGWLWVEGRKPWKVGSNTGAFWQLIVSILQKTLNKIKAKLLANALNGLLHNTKKIYFCNCASTTPSCSGTAVALSISWSGMDNTLLATALKFHALHRNSNCWLGRHSWRVPSINGQQTFCGNQQSKS